MLVCSNRPLSLSVPRFVTISSPYLSRPFLFSTTLYLIAFEAIEAFALSDARVTKLNTKLNNVKSYFLRSLKKKKKRHRISVRNISKFPNSCVVQFFRFKFRFSRSIRNFTQISQLTIIFHPLRFVARITFDYRTRTRVEIHEEDQFGPASGRTSFRANFPLGGVKRPLVNYRDFG